LVRLAGFDIFIHWSWLLIFALVTWSLASGYLPDVYPDWSGTAYLLAAGVTSVIFFGSVLVHELSHSLEARRRGLSVGSITLFLLGGISSLTDEPKRARDEFWIAIVGPLTSFLLGALFAGAWFVAGGQGWEPIAAVAGYLAIINLSLGVFNLLPGFPLDGGRVLRSALWGASGNFLTATRRAAVAGIVSIVSGSISGLWTVMIGWFIWNAAGGSVEQGAIRRSLDGLTVAQVVSPAAAMLPPDLTLDRLGYALLVQTDDRPFFVGIEGGEPMGIITRAELLRIPHEAWGRTTVFRAMTPRERFVCIEAATPAADALLLTTEHDAPVLVVFQGRELLGIATRAALLQAVQARARGS
jgi:Zn-dependent protease